LRPQKMREQVGSTGDCESEIGLAALSSQVARFSAVASRAREGLGTVPRNDGPFEQSSIFVVLKPRDGLGFLKGNKVPKRNVKGVSKESGRTIVLKDSLQVLAKPLFQSLRDKGCHG
jgi:hypothetical protein